jgi:hypothetical protein
MASIDEIIKQSFNPFDNYASANFWLERQEQALTVESIHQEAIAEIESTLQQVARDHTPRTLILYGDSGVGKTYFLGRLKKTLNPQAFFVYIGPFIESNYIWRHILRCTVDSLVNAPEGQKDSQLLLWLKSYLSAITNGLDGEERNLIEKIKKIGVKENSYYQSNRHKFIDILKKTSGTAGIFNANEFFGVLYELTNPSLQSLACEWLKGDLLDEDSLKKLGVGRCIDTEHAARILLANFSKLSAQTQPIVLCFDQLDGIARLPDGSIDLPALFSVNSTIHNDKWPRILIIISIRTSTWNQNKNLIQTSDKHRVKSEVFLKHITLDQAKALWATRLYPLHIQAQPKPESNIYPLTEQELTEEFPGGKALPRDVLTLGEELIQKYKVGEIIDIGKKTSFQLVWLDEFKKVEKRITRIRQCSSLELTGMLQKVLSALEIGTIHKKLLPSPTYTDYSFSYQLSDQPGKFGVVWLEEPSLKTFYYVMQACHKVVQRSLCDTLYLIRAETIGNSQQVGHKIYREIFTGAKHRRIEPDLTSVHYLVTYYNLVNTACAGDLVVGRKVINLQGLEALIRESEIMQKCPLFQELRIFPKRNGNGVDPRVEQAKEFLFNLVKSNQILGRNILINKVKEEFTFVKESQVEQFLQQLCQEKKIQIIPPNAQPETQSVCWIPNN